jgi:GDPmannose 4,6-dehydratase
MKRAFITGITGQDGSYLAELLFEKGYEVHGFVRRASTFNRERIDHLHLRDKKPLILHYGDMTDQSSIVSALSNVKPDEIYNLAAQSHVKVSFEEPEYTANSDALGTLRILEAIRILGCEKETKFYQASTSELFGGIGNTPQNERTPFYPRSPYAVAKLYAYWITIGYREAYEIFGSNGILFNHESPRRGENFVTRKITLGVSRIYHNMQDKLILGNLDSKRDWGYAPEYVECMWRILQQNKPDDFVVATGETHTIRELVEKAFEFIGVRIEWVGNGIEECGVDSKSGKKLVVIDPKYFRPTEVDLLLGDYRKANSELGWSPAVKFEELVRIMMSSDMNYVENLVTKH